MGVMDGRGGVKGLMSVGGFALLLLGGCDGSPATGNGADNNGPIFSAYQPKIGAGFRDVPRTPDSPPAGEGGFRDVPGQADCDGGVAPTPDLGPPPAPAPDGGSCEQNCLPGTADCNRNDKDGCEIDILNDVRNCGGCGRLCAEAANAKASCSGGACRNTCNTGYADCDQAPNNGCEVNLNTDAANCGACGKACAMGSTCTNGVCVKPGCLGNNMPAPSACDAGKDPETGDAYTVCRGDCKTAWVSAASSGHYHAEQICKILGYGSLGTFGGTCGNTCGFCEAPTTCNAPGVESYDGHGDCGSDAFGKILCFTVQWQCLK